MPYVIAPAISKHMQGLWAEGSPYTSEVIYDICSPDLKSPPVNYSSHTIKPHSVCHFDAPKHIIDSGKTIDQLFTEQQDIFYGKAVVVRLKGNNFLPHARAPSVLHWEVSKQELQEGIGALGKVDFSSIQKILLTFHGAQDDFYSKQNTAFTISTKAAAWLTSLPKFNLFGTIWKSTDFQPGERDRPIHRAIFEKGGILECLNLSHVPQGEYFLSAFPLPIESASESPVCPVLYSRDELNWV